MSRSLILKELVLFLKYRKKWWLTPIVLSLLLLGVLILLAEQSSVSPFIYTIF